MPSESTSKDYLNDIVVRDLRLVGEQFRLSAEPPRGGLNVNLEVSNAHTTNAKSEDGKEYLSEVASGVHVTLTEPDDGTLRAEIIVETDVACTMPQGVTGEEESFRRLRVEAVRAGYEFARARVLELAAVSPLQHLTLPSIDPDKVVAHIAQNDTPDVPPRPHGNVLDIDDLA